MNKRQLFIAFAITAVFAGGLPVLAAGGNEEPVGPDPNQPAAGNILEIIPADSLGFIVAPNLKDMLAAVEKMAVKTGLNESMPVAPGSTLPMLSSAVGLGKGFNPNGGVAMVITDLAKSGLNPETLATNPEMAMAAPPFALVVAGKSVETAFPKMIQKTPEGKTAFMLPGLGPAQTRQIGDYIVISPNPKVIAQFGAGNNILKSMPAAEKSVIESCSASLYYNIKAAAPLIEKLMEAQEKQMKESQPGAEQPTAMMGPMGEMFDMMKLYTDMMKQVQGMAMGLKMSDTGIAIDMAVDYVPGTSLAEQVASIKPAAASLLGKLPANLWVMAGGMTANFKTDKKSLVDAVDMLDTLLKQEGIAVSDDIKQKVINLALSFGDEITAVRFAGGSPVGEGVFSLSMVFSCKDAAKMKMLMGQECTLVNDIVQTVLAPKEPDFKSLKFEYVKGAESVGGMTVDAVEMKHASLAELDEQQKKRMTSVIGEDTMRALVASPDAKTVVVTFGGGMKFLREAVAAATKGGTIQNDPGVAAALKELPEKRYFTMVFNMKNLLKAIRQGAVKVGEESDLPPSLKIDTDVPVAMGATAEGNTARMTIFAPAELVKQVYNAVMTIQRKQGESSGSADSTAKPAPKPSDF